LAAVSQDGLVRWWDPATGKQVKVWEPFGAGYKALPGLNASYRFSAATLSANGRVLAAQVSTSHPLAGFDPAQGKWVVQPNALLPSTHQCVVWDLAQARQLWSLNGLRDGAWLLALSADNRILACTGALFANDAWPKNFLSGPSGLPWSPRPPDVEFQYVLT